MLYFPQLLSGATAQYPFSKRRVARTVSEIHIDGHSSKMADPSAAVLEWRLSFSGLTDEERAAIESLFEAAEGRFGEFTFLDPTDNLLKWSEEFGSAAWVKGPMLQLTAGVPDPAGGDRATRITNAGAAAQTIRQTINAPSWFQYCFSCYARSPQPGSVTMFRSGSSTQQSKMLHAGPDWRRFSHVGALPQAEEQITFGFSLEAGTTVEVYGLQVEAQPSPSPYRKTTTRGGVYTKSRFADDSLSVTTDGPGAHSCTLRVVSPLSD